MVRSDVSMQSHAEHVPREQPYSPGMSTSIGDLSLTPNRIAFLRELLAAKYGIVLDDEELYDGEEGDDMEESQGPADEQSYFVLTDAEQSALWRDIVSGRIRPQTIRQTKNWIRQSMRASRRLSVSGMLDGSLEASSAIARPTIRVGGEPPDPSGAQNISIVDNARASGARAFTPTSSTPRPPRGGFRSPEGALELDASLAELVVPDEAMTQPRSRIISDMPTGRTLRIYIHSTWGDQHFVGMTGIEAFDGAGDLMDSTMVESIDVAPQRAAAADAADPHPLKNIVDGYNVTCDDGHMWLAPWNASEPPVVTLRWRVPVTLSMLRIYNYNKDRIHSFRGVRHATIFLDDVKVFEGEIRRASGKIPDNLRDSLAPSASAIATTLADACEQMLFTSDADTLRRIALSDPLQFLLTELVMQRETADATIDFAHSIQQQARPGTATSAARSGAATTQLEALPEGDEEFDVDRLLEELDASGVGSASESRSEGPPQRLSESKPVPTASLTPATFLPPDAVSLDAVPFGQRICLTLVASHGDPTYMGLTGLEVLVVDAATRSWGRVVERPLSMAHVSAFPSDINVAGHAGDVRTLDKLVDGVDVTDDDCHMWLVHGSPQPPVLVVDLKERMHIAGLRIYNYNQPGDASSRGVRLCRISIDGCPVLSDRVGRALGQEYDLISLWKGPGSPWYDFGQSLRFATKWGPQGVRYYVTDPDEVALRASTGPPSSIPVLQDSEPPQLPVGHVLKFVFEESCGDPFYMGLDALALYDAAGVRIPTRADMIHVLSASIRDEKSGLPDARQATNLAFDRSATPAAASDNECVARRDDPQLYELGGLPAARTFLATKLPTAPGVVTQPPVILVIAFPLPIALSFIRVVNYSKTPLRGVGAMDIWMDDTLLFSGELRPNVSAGRMAAVQQSSVVLFRKDKEFVDAVLHRSKSSYCGQQEQDVLCFNEGALSMTVSSKRAIERSTAVKKLYQASAKAGHAQLVRPSTSVVRR